MRGWNQHFRKVQRSRTPRWHCERRFWSLRSLYWTRIICVSNDSSKSKGCHCKATRLWWTSSRRRISIHTGKISKVRMFTNIDTSSTTQVAKILVQHRRPSGSSWTNFVRTPTRRPLVVKTIWGKSMDLGWEKVSNWEYLFVRRQQGLFLSVYMDDIKMAGENQNMAPMWKKLMKLWILENQHHSLTMYTWDVLNVKAHRTKVLLTNIQRNVRITNCCWSNSKITRVGKTPRQDGRMVLRHGMACSNMRWKKLRVGE